MSVEQDSLASVAGRVSESAEENVRIRLPDFRHAGDWGVGLIIAAALAAPALCLGDIRNFDENAPIELAQCALALGASLFFLAAAVRSSDRLSILALGWLSLFNLVILVREIEFRGTPLEAWLGGPLEKDADYIVLGILSLILLLFSAKYLSALVRAGTRWIFMGAGRLMIAGTVFYLLGDVGEKNLLSSSADVNLIFEESFELYGTLFFFVCAYTTLRLRTVFAPAILRRMP